MNTQQFTTTASYRTTAAATRARRQAAGCYVKPTPAQDAAYRKSIARNGNASLTAQDCTELAQHPWLTHAQQDGYTKRAVAMSAYAAGQQAYTDGTYNPPHFDSTDYDGYLRGYNDAWAEAIGRTSWQSAR